jgi:hypothetical protein
MNTLRAIGFAFVLASGLLVLPIVQRPSGAGELTASAVEQATTAADHNALADSYDKIAADARANAEMHRKMREAYQRQSTRARASGVSAMKLHCSRLVTQYENAAADAEMLADLHRQAAAGK